MYNKASIYNSGRTGYEQHSIDVGTEGGVHHVIGITERSVTVISANTGNATPWDITIDNDCTDAVIILRYDNGDMYIGNINIKRANGMSLTLYGKKGQLVGGSVEDTGCTMLFNEYFNGINGEAQCSEVAIRICGDIALLSFLSD